MTELEVVPVSDPDEAALASDHVTPVESIGLLLVADALTLTVLPTCTDAEAGLTVTATVRPVQAPAKQKPFAGLEQPVE